MLPSVGLGIYEGQSKVNKIKGTKQKRLRIFTIEIKMKNLHVSENRRGRDWKKKKNREPSSELLISKSIKREDILSLLIILSHAMINGSYLSSPSKYLHNSADTR